MKTTATIATINYSPDTYDHGGGSATYSLRIEPENELERSFLNVFMNEKRTGGTFINGKLESILLVATKKFRKGHRN
jgi:hypothetical protein